MSNETKVLAGITTIIIIVVIAVLIIKKTSPAPAAATAGATAAKAPGGIASIIPSIPGLNLSPPAVQTYPGSNSGYNSSSLNGILTGAGGLLSGLSNIFGGNSGDDTDSDNSQYTSDDTLASETIKSTPSDDGLQIATGATDATSLDTTDGDYWGDDWSV